MPLQKLVLRPGLNREGTNYSNEGGWYDGDKIRFRSGNPEKLGGWTRLSSNTYLGQARSLWNWMDLGGENYLGVGTSLKYYIEKGGAYNDITPIYYSSYDVSITGSIAVTTGILTVTAVAYGTLTVGMGITGTSIPSGTIISSFIGGSGLTGTYQTTCFTAVASTTITTPLVPFNTSGPFTATSGSSALTITDIAYNPSAGDYITISGAVSLGGAITAAVLNQEYVVTSVPTTTTYTIVAKDPTTGLPVLANGSDTLHGSPTTRIDYQYPTGIAVATAGIGWNTGPWAQYVPVTLTNPFTATSAGVSILTVTQVAHGLVTGNYVYFNNIASNPCGINRLVLQKAFPITKTGADTYTISTVIGSTTYLTTSAGASGGSVTVDVPNGVVHVWGGPYASVVASQLRIWSNDNYGQDLIIAPRGGPIFYWRDVSTIAARAVALSTLATNAGYAGTYVPFATNQILASALQRFIIAFGANSYISGMPGTPFDPMLVRWSDQNNPYQWVPSITNQSGEFRLTHGSYIVSAQVARVENLIWTDSCLYSMQYLGPPYVYQFNVLMDNISIISPNAAITVNNNTYWMGLDKFYIYNGVVDTLVCDLKQYVFEDLNPSQNAQVFVGGNSGYNEVWWFYCSEDSTTINRYVIYNYLDKVWYSGNMARTAWLDSGIRQYPMAADYNSRILYHESAVDDVSGDTPVAIHAYVQSSDFDIEDGQSFGFIWRMLPDVNFNGSNIDNPEVRITIVPRQNSGAPYGTAVAPMVTSADNYAPPYPPNSSVYVVQQFTGQVYTRLRGRQMSFKIESDTKGVAWQLGMVRFDRRPDGRR